MNCYTYYIKHIPTNYKYYGVRYSIKCEPNDLWSTYFTSCKKVHNLIDEYGKESFVVEVRKIFGSNKIRAQEWEKKVLSRLNVLYREDWLNSNIGGIINLTPEQKKKHSENISKSKKGKSPWNKGLRNIYSLETLQKMSTNGKKNKGKPKPPQHGKNVSKGLSGRPKSEEHKRKLAEVNLNRPGIKVTDGEKIFDSIAICARYYNVTQNCIKARCESTSKKQSRFQFVES